MSFTDLMSSGRGPGLLGMLLALVVLIGFGVLSMFVFDERFQGAEQSIESVIAQQAKDVEHLECVIVNHRKTMVQLPALRLREKELEGVRREIMFAKDKADGLRKGIASGKDAIAAMSKQMDAYKDKYRAFARNKVKGEKMDRFVTRDGTVYEHVTIGDITAVGMRISHDNGATRIPFEQLSEELQDKFQFDTNQKAMELASEDAMRKAHDSSVDKTLATEKRKAEQQQIKNVGEERTNRMRAVEVKQSRILSMEKEVERLEKAIQAESHKRISQAPQLRDQLAKTQCNLTALRADVARLRSGL
jgi:hypothetical protein